MQQELKKISMKKKNNKTTTTSEKIQTQEDESKNTKADLVLITCRYSINIINPQIGSIQTEKEIESVKIETEFSPQNKLIKNDDVILTTLEILKSENFEEICDVMSELSEKLSLAHESIAENPNCTQLIKELIKLLEKYQIPELLSKF